MKYLLDTNTCIRYLNGTSEKIKYKFSINKINDLTVCSIVKAELLFGALKSRQSIKNLEKVEQFLSPFSSLPFDDTSAKYYGQIRSTLEKQGKPIGPNDLMIASIALSNNLILVTHNKREFSRIEKLEIEDWEE